MKLYRSLGRIWTGTQADAKAAQGGIDYESVEVPTDKPSLIAWLNEHATGTAGSPASEPTQSEVATAGSAEHDQGREAIRARSLERFAEQARKLGWTPPGETGIQLDLSAHALAEIVHDLPQASLLPVLGAALGRLNELAGIEGWKAFAKQSRAFGGGYNSGPERALGMLLLAGLARREDKPSD